MVLMDTQQKTVLVDALRKHLNNRVVRFDVPGHKGGRGNKEFRDFIGEEAMKMDVNSMKPLDNLCHPTSVIREAQDIAAKAFGAKEAYFMVSGTTGSVQAMIMSTCKAGDKLIMPRNVHRSAINALVICGATPVYINPGLNKKLGISLGMSVSDVKKAIKENPDVFARDNIDFSWAFEEEFLAMIRSDASNSRPKVIMRIEYVKNKILAQI